jgi:biopolymer transport protein ExbD
MGAWLDYLGIGVRGSSRKRTGKKVAGEDSAAIDLTPMLDVIFIMLIFFIVTGSFVRETTLEVQRKQASNAESTGPADTISILISATNEIWIKGRRVDVRAVRANINRMHAENPKASVMITAHQASTMEAVVAVVDSSREAGVYAVSLTTAGDNSN